MESLIWLRNQTGYIVQLLVGSRFLHSKLGLAWNKSYTDIDRLWDLLNLCWKLFLLLNFNWLLCTSLWSFWFMQAYSLISLWCTIHQFGSCRHISSLLWSKRSNRCNNNRLGSLRRIDKRFLIWRTFIWYFTILIFWWLFSHNIVNLSVFVLLQLAFFTSNCIPLKDSNWRSRSGTYFLTDNIWMLLCPSYISSLNSHWLICGTSKCTCLPCLLSHCCQSIRSIFKSVCSC